MAKTTAIRRSKAFSSFMYIASLTCDFGDFDEKMVVSLTRCTMSALENGS